jgi:hypothetical protein
LIIVVKANGLSALDPNFTAFVSQAAEAYITSILTAMCSASDHRANTDYEVLLEANGTGTGEYELDIYEDDNIKLDLVEIEARERELQENLYNAVGPRPTEEELEEMQEQGSSLAGTQNLSSQTVSQKTSGQSTDSKKSKKSVKKDLPEAVKNKMTNNAALMAAGGTMKSWMLPGASIAAPTPSKIIPKEIQISGDTPRPVSTVRTGSRLRVQKRITIKDALFTMEGYRHLKTTELFYKWWASVK